MHFGDPTFVREQYADEKNLAARKSAYGDIEGPDPRVLEVGGGEGELAERIVNELGCDLVGVDQSERMVEIQRSKGIEARIGDVQALPFGDGEFDLAIAAWMLYHVVDLDRALSELARVLRSGGHLLAVTNASDHLLELHELAGVDKRNLEWLFRSENGEKFLRRHFARVEQRDGGGWVTMDDATMRSYAASWDLLTPILELPPQEPLRIRRRTTIFVAEKASVPSERANRR
jgi:ubiquinone/menaquinone biosynthesis C-methylase UbiE